MNWSKLRAAVAVSLTLVGIAAPAVPATAAPAQPIAGATITPTSVEAGSAGLTFDIAYQVSNAPFRGYAGSQIPAAWTRPQRSSAGGPGYVEAVPGTCTKVSLAYVSTSAGGPWTVAIDANCKANQTFSLRYRNAAAPTTAGPNTFPSGSLLTSSSSVQPVSPHPVVTVRPGPAVALAVSGFPSPVAAGTTGTATIAGVDRYGNRNAPLSGDVAVTTSDQRATVPAAAPLVNGSRQADVVFRTAGTQSITATSTVNPAVTGAQSGIAVQPGALARIELSPATADVPAGVAQPYTAEGFDAFDNSRGAVAPTLSIAPSGTCGSADCQDTAAGAHTVTATVDGITDTATLNVLSGQPSGFDLTGVPAASTAGQSFAVGIRAVDQYGNTAADYSGPVRVTSSDANAALPGPKTLANGEGTVTVALRTAGPQTISVTDVDMPALTTTSSPIEVSPAAAHHLVLDPATASVAAGETVTYTATAADAYGNSRGPVTAELSISPDGWCRGDTCMTQSAGLKTVTATSDGLTGTATIDVSPEVITVLPANLPGAAIGESYSAQFEADGAIGDTTFALASGSLPPGLSLSQSGALTGVPTAVGTSHFVVRATDANQVFAERAYDLVVRDVFTITPDPADFGSVALTNFADRTFTITNNGARTVFFNSVSVNDDWNFPSFSGCFATELAPGQSCTHTPRFQPSSEGPHRGTFRLGWYDTADTSRSGVITAAMLGVGTPELTIAPSPADFGSVALTNFADRTFTITNHGAKTVFFNSVSVDDDWNFPSFSGCFATELAPGQSCTHTPRFQPDNEGLHSGTFRLGWYDTANTSRSGALTAPMTGVATPQFGTSPNPADFGDVAITSSAERTITITNNGTRTVFFNSVSVDDDWNFPSFAGCFATELAPGASCTQTPRFQPGSEGWHFGTFRLGWYESANTSRTGQITVPMSGRATPQLSAAPSPADFGAVPVTNSAERTITITNNGTRTVFFNSVSVDDDWNFPSFAGCFATELAPGASCTQTPRFQPGSEGAHNGTFRLGWYDPANTSRTGALTVAMKGVGTAELRVTPSPVDFGSAPVTNFTDRTLTITNRGTRNLTFNSVSVDDDWIFPSFSGCFATTLAPGASCTQSPRFQPGTEGPHSGTFRLGWYDAANTSRSGSITVAMTGLGTPQFSASPSPADFGDTPLLTGSDRTITVVNNGTRSATFNSVSVDDDWFFQSFSGCFATTLAPGASCTQTPTFRPRTEGPHNGTFRLGWYDPASTSRTGTITVPMRGRGVGELALSPGYVDAGSVAVTNFADSTVTVTNNSARTVRFNAVSVDDDWHFPSFAGCFGTDLAPGASCTHTFRFQPDNEGAHTGTFSLGWYDPVLTSRTGTLRATLAGTATPQLTAAPNPLAYGEVPVGTHGDQTVTVTNHGTRTVFFNSVSVDDDWNFPSFSGCFAIELAPGASCTQTPRFQPRSGGLHNGTFRLGWYDVANNSRSGQVVVPMTGDGG